MDNDATVKLLEFSFLYFCLPVMVGIFALTFFSLTRPITLAFLNAYARIPTLFWTACCLLVMGLGWANGGFSSATLFLGCWYFIARAPWSLMRWILAPDAEAVIPRHRSFRKFRA